MLDFVRSSPKKKSFSFIGGARKSLQIPTGGFNSGDVRRSQQIPLGGFNNIDKTLKGSPKAMTDMNSFNCAIS